MEGARALCRRLALRPQYHPSIHPSHTWDVHNADTIAGAREQDSIGTEEDRNALLDLPAVPVPGTTPRPGLAEGITDALDATSRNPLDRLAGLWSPLRTPQSQRPECAPQSHPEDIRLSSPVNPKSIRLSLILFCSEPMLSSVVRRWSHPKMVARRSSYARAPAGPELRAWHMRSETASQPQSIEECTKRDDGCVAVLTDPITSKPDQSPQNRIRHIKTYPVASETTPSPQKWIRHVRNHPAASETDPIASKWPRRLTNQPTTSETDPLPQKSPYHLSNGPVASKSNPSPQKRPRRLKIESTTSETALSPQNHPTTSTMASSPQK
ncbi:hypothetical protein BU15DRAFT_78648 [Melanogaster broomeanus]|nr:hypothetical protein BU15DRAFT_78648 [Melanogaster broomeanus]